MIYIVEDDASIRDIESYALNSRGFETRCFESGKGFISQCLIMPPELVILDLMLPGEDGMSLLKKLKTNEQTKAIPVIIVSARDTEFDAVKCLDGGADDYINKPFGVMELISRVNAVLRRAQKPKQAEKLSFGGIEIDDEAHSVTVCGKDCSLTYKEYRLLYTLVRNKGIVLSRDKLLELVWDTDSSVETRTVDMHITSLRRKLGDCGGMIKTVRNVGYKLVEE